MNRKARSWLRCRQELFPPGLNARKVRILAAIYIAHVRFNGDGRFVLAAASAPAQVEDPPRAGVIVQPAIGSHVDVSGTSRAALVRVGKVRNRSRDARP
jgi:hypothetical protein